MKEKKELEKQTKYKTREQEMIRDVMREFAKNEVEPIAAEIDETGRFPEETVEK